MFDFHRLLTDHFVLVRMKLFRRSDKGFATGERL